MFLPNVFFKKLDRTLIKHGILLSPKSALEPKASEEQRALEPQERLSGDHPQISKHHGTGVAIVLVMNQFDLVCSAGHCVLLSSNFSSVFIYIKHINKHSVRLC